MIDSVKKAALDLCHAVKDKLFEILKKDRTARKAEPANSESPLILIKIPKWRSYFFILMIDLAFIGLIAKAFWLQIVDVEFLQDQGEARYARTLQLAGSRGEILDRNGVVLASSQPVRTVWADPEYMEATPEDIRNLAQALGMSVSTLKRKLANSSSKNYVALLKNTEISVADAVQRLGIKGVGVSSEVQREYADGPVMAHIVGYTGWDGRGLEGVELAKDEELSGNVGQRRVIKDRLGRIVDDLWAKPAQPGNDVSLSIDSRVQFIAHEALQQAIDKTEAAAGAVVVADVETGEIIALANSPTYDPNDRSSFQFERVRNRVLTDQFEPGSTMKPFAIAKALDMGIVDPSTTIQTAPGKLRIKDRIIGDTHDYGLLTVSEIVAKSSNIGTVKIALEIPPQTLWDTYSQLGFGRAPNIGFPGATAGRMRPASSWRPIEQATISYGHGITVSLMQLVRAYTALARDGEVIDLTLFKRAEGEKIEGDRVFSSETARKMRAMMVNTVKRGGTGSRVKVAGYSVAGKTGTANKVKNGRYTNDVVASFVGIVPATKPKFIIAVMIDEPKRGSHFGGLAATPVFNEVAAGALRTLMVTPDDNSVSKSGGLLSKIRR